MRSNKWSLADLWTGEWFHHRRSARSGSSIHPYAVATPMTANAGMVKLLEEHPQYLHSVAPMPVHALDTTAAPGGRADITVDEVPEVVVWLAGDAANTLTAARSTSTAAS
ncbi:hypothetical protein [Mycobacterium sp. URHB0021]